MRICRVSQTYPTNENNGKGLHCYHVSKLNKVPTVIFTKNYKDETYWPEPENVILHKIRYWQHPFPKDNSFSVDWLMSVFSYFFGQIQFLIGSVPALIKFQPTITHIQSPHAIFIGLFNKLFFKTPILLTFHGSDLLRIKNIKPYHFLLRKVDAILYVNPDMLEDLERIFPNVQKINSPSGVDLSFFNNLPKKRKRQLVAVGNLRWQKAYEDLLQSFYIFLKEYPDYKLIIAGDGDLKQDLIKQSELLGISNSVIFLGRVSSQKIKSILLESELFVMSSVTEGMPKALLEALASHLPVVVTDVGACKKLSTDVGLCVECRNPPAFARAIDKVLNDKDKYQQYVQNCRKKIEGNSWSNLASIILETMKKLEEN